MNKYGEILNKIEDFLVLAEKVYGPYKNRENGRQLVVIKNDDGTSRTVSYPKYLMEQHLGRQLGIDETVDHWDSNVDNNNLDNLRVVPRHEHSADDTRRVKPAKVQCALCQKEFERSPRLIRDKSRKNKAGPFCSRQCAGRYSRKLQLKLLKKLGPQPMLESQYYKKKYED
jgi:HNH endonuclease